MCDMCLQTAPGKSRKEMGKNRQTIRRGEGRRLCVGSWLEGVQSGTVGSTARHEHKAGVVEEQEREF